MEDQWLTWTKKLHALASSGRFYGESDFDQDRYHEMQTITLEMMSALTGNRSTDDIAALIFDAGNGYSTPKVDVRGAVFKDNKILLVQEKLDQLWTMPGGFADVGISPQTNIIKEISEEANIAVKVNKLIAVIHKAGHEYDADLRDFYKLYFLCEALDETLPSIGMETLDVGYFDLDALPPLSKGRVIEKHIKLAFEHHQNQSLATVFD